MAKLKNLIGYKKFSESVAEKSEYTDEMEATKNELLDFYSKENLKNGGFQTLVDELCDIGFSHEDSVSAIKSKFNITEISI